MRQSNLLLLNTAAVYLRAVLTVPMGLLVVRFAYRELGEVDFGLWTTLGATTAVMSVVTGSLIISAQRHLAYEIGAGDPARVRSVFQTLLATFFVCTVGLLLAGGLLAPAVLDWLTIPKERADAAWWVLHLSLATLAVNAALTPYRALLNAHQAITALSTAELLLSFLTLASAWSLQYTESDKLVIYVALQLLATLFCGLYVVVIAFRSYPVSHSLPYLQSRKEMADIGRFAAWSFLSNMSNVLRVQGAVVAVNVLFGPVANSAIALGGQAQSYLIQAGYSFNRAIGPALTTQAGRRNKELVSQLMNFGCKLPTLAVSLLYVPLVLETETVLRLWQEREVPTDTATHTRWLATMALLGTMTWGHHLVLEAENRIGPVARVTLGTVVAALGVSWVGCAYLNWPAWSFSVLVCLATGVSSLLVRPWFVAVTTGQSSWEVIRSSAFPCFVALSPGLLTSLVVVALWEEGPWRLLAVTVLNGAVTLALAWRLAFNDTERRLLFDLAHAVLHRIQRRKARR